MIRVQIDHFEGETLATLTPNLSLVIDLGHTHPRIATNTGTICSKCCNPIQTFGFWHRINEPPRPEKVLRCRCVALVYRRPIVEADLLRS
jgi:hypothetical protein